jgi:hypothetical protein
LTPPSHHRRFVPRVPRIPRRQPRCRTPRCLRHGHFQGNARLLALRPACANASEGRPKAFGRRVVVPIRSGLLAMTRTLGLSPRLISPGKNGPRPFFPIPVPYSRLFPIPCSLFPVPCALFSFPCSLPTSSLLVRTQATSAARPLQGEAGRSTPGKPIPIHPLTSNKIVVIVCLKATNLLFWLEIPKFS